MKNPRNIVFLTNEYDAQSRVTKQTQCGRDVLPVRVHRGRAVECSPFRLLTVWT